MKLEKMKRWENCVFQRRTWVPFYWCKWA